MKRAALAAGAAALLAALVVGGARFVAPGGPVVVDVPEGLTARQTTDLLARKGIVQSVFVFRVLLKVTGLDRELKPGTYTLREREWPTVIARKLALGVTDAVKVTIPEGFMAAQIAERLEKAGIIPDAREFRAIVEKRKLEGRLFPSTYHMPRGYGAPKAISAMTAEFDRQIGAAYAAASPKPDLSLEEALIVASIVEREAVLKTERPIIAAVYLNRLRIKMPLQADPTVQYALNLGYWKKGLTHYDLKTPSAYNTYIRRGLPPGPICSPGVEAFKAVLSPAKTGALYFVADMTGGHLFSETNEEHSKARMMYKKQLRKEKERLKREAAGR
ncbi:MAG: endolytic transglycosylase MltG [Elusimicrobiota bacterium]|nr:endolytic transglycosylase MltG [Elusimicrobiota bacterium]